MAFRVSLQHLARITEATLRGHLDVDIEQVMATGVSTDTRTLKPQNVFVALRGERFDGHEFVHQAMKLGALAAIVDNGARDAVAGNNAAGNNAAGNNAAGNNAANATMRQMLVRDTLAAYQAIAHWWRKKLNTPLVAVTGSVGKTTTKELIAAALSTCGTVLKTQANYNNEVGVPKTLLELNESHCYGVIEMGMRARGEIALLAKIAEPDVGVITNVGTAHIGRLGSEQAIAEAKCELLAELPPHGIAVLNYDNARLMKTAKGVWSGKQITFGLEGGDIQGRLLDSQHLEVNGVSLPLPLPGRHNASNLLAAIAVMEAFGLDWHCLRKGLSVDLPSGRAHHFLLPNDIEFLDETYNAGVESMTAALHLLKETPGQRHIAVLGTMKELGGHSITLHQQVGKVVRELQLDRLMTLADPAEAEALASSAAPIPVEHFEDQTGLVKRLEALLRPGDRVLFKASRMVALDQVIKQLRPISHQ